ncbi:MAG: hypothetical protein MJZ64_03410, partial [Paludibacteraceae bacterium]|nr:hypothetical protein [Paludibacteraceae bacterium]
DADLCEKYNNELMTAFQAASQDMYNAANAGQAGAQGAQGNPFTGPNGPFNGGQQGPTDNGSNKGNNAEDVDFEEVK